MEGSGDEGKSSVSLLGPPARPVNLMNFQEEEEEEAIIRGTCAECLACTFTD